MQQPVLVLGASSLIGRFVLPKLDAAGIAHVPVSRQLEPGWLRADIQTPEGRAALPSAPTILACSPIWLLPDLVDTLKANGMRRMIAFSSTSVVTKANSPHADERAVVARLQAGEAAVRGSGVDWTILRPTLIYAEGRDGNVSRLASLARRFGFLPIAGSGSGLRQPVHAEDLATAAIAAADEPAAIGQTYDLTGGETLSYRVMCERIFEGLGQQPRIVSLPPAVWRAGLTLAAPFLPGATAQMGERMDRDLFFDASAAHFDLDYRPRPFQPKF